MQILLGCGHSREKKLFRPGFERWEGLVTLDSNPHCKPDVRHDLCKLPLPFAGDSADEMHAYDVLEHVGPQGDWLWFFSQFEDFHRILRDGGHFFGICPRWDSVWAWGDPGHTRVVSPALLSFLDQAAYHAECRPGGTNRTDYRAFYTADFEMVWQQDLNDAQWAFALRAHKPARRFDV
jgi:hypothetical protein